MSKSFRDRPTWKTAKVRIKQDNTGKIVFPKIIRRKCLKTDFYPFEKTPLQEMLKSMPTEYFYGLKNIQLRPRRNSQIGEPFGVYWPDQKIIIIYSVPKGLWEFEELSRGWQEYFEGYDAVVKRINNSSVTVKWVETLGLAFFMYEVILHEMGHHYEKQYKTKKKVFNNKKSSERYANFKMSKMREEDYFRAWVDNRR